MTFVVVVRALTGTATDEAHRPAAAAAKEERG
jgi:hypothetical protein